MRNPFADDIFSGDQDPAGQIASIHDDALRWLGDRVPAEAGGPGLGRAVVVTAARAGFGKTQLVNRFAGEWMGRAIVVPLEFDLEKEPRWSGLLWDILEKLHRDHSHRSGLTLLDEAARFLFGRVNQRLIEEKKVPCAHPAEAVAALERNYLEMFDFSNPGQAVAQWFGEHFQRLTPMSSESLAPVAGIDRSSAIFWLQVLMSYAQAAGEPPEKRLESLRWAVNMASGPAVGTPGGMAIIQERPNAEVAAKEKLRDFGRVLSLYRPIVFVIDHLDVFYRDGQAGLKIGYLVSELRRLLPRSLSVVCANADLWEATFRTQLPSALEDRMTGGVLTLAGVTIEQAEELIRRRAEAAGVDPVRTATFIEYAKLGELFAGHGVRTVSARAVLRHAARRWEESLRPSQPGVITAPSGFPAIQAFTPHGMAESGSLEAANSGPAAAFEATPSSTGAEASIIGDDALESITEAIGAMVGPVPTEAAGPVATPNATAPTSPQRSAFQEFKEKLEAIRQPRPTENRPDPPTNGAPTDDPAETAFIENFRRQISAPLSPGLDWERLSDLLRFAGEHSPAVRSAEFHVPGAAGNAIQWLSPDAEIIFGLEPATRPTFWSALTASAVQRAKQNGGLTVKVVVFAERSTAAHPAAAAWQPSGGAFVLDLVETSPADLAAISAASELITQSEAGAVPASSAQVASVLARQLDAFWRRLTRVPAAA